MKRGGKTSKPAYNTRTVEPYNQEIINYALKAFEQYIINLPPEIRQNWGIPAGDLKLYLGPETEYSYVPVEELKSTRNNIISQLKSRFRKDTDNDILELFAQFIAITYPTIGIKVVSDGLYMDDAAEINGIIFKNVAEYLAFYEDWHN